MGRIRLVGVWLLSVAPVIVAQEAAEPPTGTAESRPPVAEIFAARRDLEAFEQSLGRIDAAAARSEWQARVAAAREGLEPVSSAVAGDLEALSIESLFDLETRVRGALVSLDQAANAWSVRARTRDRQLDELADRHAKWRTLAGAARARDAPPEVMSLIESTEPRFAALAATLRDDRDAALVALSQLSELELDATAFGAEIRSRREGLADSSRRAEGMPIWSATLIPTARAWSDGGTTLLGYTFSIRSYLQTNWVAVLGWLVGLWGAAYWLLRVTGAGVQNYFKNESHTMLALRVFERPLFAALLIALLGMLAFAPPAPVMFRNIVGAVLTFPAAALATIVFAKQLRLSVYALAAALSMLALSPVFESPPILSRLVFLVQTLVVGIAFYIDLKRGRWAEAFPMVSWRHFGLLVRGVCVVLTLILLTDVAGFVGVANTLRTLVLGGLGLALIFTALGHVFAGLALALLQVRPFSGTNVVRYRSWTVITFVRRAIRLAAATAWLVTTLMLSDLWTPVAAALGAALATEIKYGELSVGVSALAAGAVVLLAAWLTGRFIRFVVESQPGDGAQQVAKGATIAISTLLRYAIAAVAFVLALAVMGFDLTRVTVLAGALGVGIGFGLQNIVNNFISGIILLFERPIQVNDIAQVDQLMGTIKAVGVRSTIIRTFDGAEVIVPNADFISKSVVNWTKSDRRRRAEIDVGVAYGADPDRIIEILETVALSHDEVIKDPAAFAVFTGFGESSLNFRLYVWLADLSDMLQTPSTIRSELLRALTGAGIGIPFPQRDIRVTLSPPATELPAHRPASDLRTATSREKVS